MPGAPIRRPPARASLLRACRPGGDQPRENGSAKAARPITPSQVHRYPARVRAGRGCAGNWPPVLAYGNERAV
jgi:hypothetical protein